MVKTGSFPGNEAKNWRQIVRWNVGRSTLKIGATDRPSRAGLLLCLLPLQHAQHSCHCQGHWPSCHFLSHFLQRRENGAAIPSTQLLRSMLWSQLFRMEGWNFQEVKHLVNSWILPPPNSSKSSSLSQALWPYSEVVYHTLYSKASSEIDPPAISTKKHMPWHPSKSGPAPAR